MEKERGREDDDIDCKVRPREIRLYNSSEAFVKSMGSVSHWGIMASLAITAEENQIRASMGCYLSLVQEQGTPSNRALL